MSLRHLSDILNVLPMVSWATLLGAVIQYSNPAFDRMFGYSSSHFQTADQLIDVTYLHQHQRELVLER